MLLQSFYEQCDFAAGICFSGFRELVEEGSCRIGTEVYEFLRKLKISQKFRIPSVSVDDSEERLVLLSKSVVAMKMWLLAVTCSWARENCSMGIADLWQFVGDLCLFGKQRKTVDK